MPAPIENELPSIDTADPLFTKLNQTSFDLVDFLNDALPSVSLDSQTQTQRTTRSAQLQSVSTDSLAFISSLNALNIRASSDLTTLTDEIIRSGNRLAYEVEVLRGDVNGLHDLLTDTLRDDIRHFIQDEAANGVPARSSTEAASSESMDTRPGKNEPDFMTQLRLLGKVKARLEAVITIFGEAMKWSMPPSELSMATSLISVSAPELGIQSTEDDEKAREMLKAIRAEINDLLGSDGGGYQGLDAAAHRVAEYRRLALVWKGTGEEKARAKFVDTLTKMVDERKKALDGRGQPRNTRAEGLLRPLSAMGRPSKGPSEGGGAAGLFRNLQRLKDDLYLE